MSDPVGVDMKDRLKAYEATERLVWEAYEATRRPAWEAYEATERPAWEAYEATERPAWEAYEATRRPAWEAYEATRRPAWEAYEATERPAWEALKCGDPLVDWIVDNAWDYAREAPQVLAILPATLETLDALAMQNKWCSAWDDLRTAALIAGVIEEDES